LDFRLGNVGNMKKVTLSSQARKAFRGSSRGFTLVEVLITIALIGAIGVAFFSFMSVATSALIHADERTVAESLARSQMEYIKNQGYNGTTRTYQKIPSIPSGYEICSLNCSSNQACPPVNCLNNQAVVAIFWDSSNNRWSPTDTGLQKIALVIKHQGKEIYAFVNNNTAWANGAKITLEGYIRQS
jgi:prepilin-type N-terminal cleavage/methylation domain-containing protein